MVCLRPVRLSLVVHVNTPAHVAGSQRLHGNVHQTAPCQSVNVIVHRELNICRAVISMTGELYKCAGALVTVHSQFLTPVSPHCLMNPYSRMLLCMVWSTVLRLSRSPREYTCPLWLACQPTWECSSNCTLSV